MNFAINLNKVSHEYDTTNPHFFCNTDIFDYYKTLHKMLRKWLLKAIPSYSRISQQQCVEFCQELSRLKMVMRLNKVQQELKRCGNLHLKETVEASAKTLDELFKVLQSSKPYNEELKQKCEDDLKIVEKSLPDGSLGISKEEKVEIVQAMQLKQGHWFKCPEGHVYVITECGGAMEKGTCPECGATIGGTNHRLEADNQLATEMDEATTPAWPTTLAQ